MGAKGIKTALFSSNNTADSAAKLAAMIGGKAESGRVKIGTGASDVKMVKAQKGEGAFSIDVLAATASRIDTKLTHWCRMDFVAAAGWVPQTTKGTAPSPAAPNVPGPAPPTGASFFPSESSFAKIVQFVDS
jgi:hypothetical protein